MMVFRHKKIKHFGCLVATAITLCSILFLLYSNSYITDYRTADWINFFPINRTVDLLKKRYGACENTTVTKQECKNLAVSEKWETLTFPLQYISGAKGSGNDWIMWLASLSMYTWPREFRHTQCEVYDKEARTKSLMRNVRDSPCLFFKSHEPWEMRDDISRYAARGVLLLRHPYDAAFSEYKRDIVRKVSAAADWKASTEGLNISQFINPNTNTTNAGLIKFLNRHNGKWLHHAKYWLTKYNKPVHILIYNYVKENTTTEIEGVQKFLGYKFDGVNFRRHCCVMEDTMNPTLKRQPSEVDEYKEFIYTKEKQLRRAVESTVYQVHTLLDQKYPGSHYRISRG